MYFNRRHVLTHPRRRERLQVGGDEMFEMKAIAMVLILGQSTPYTIEIHPSGGPFQTRAACLSAIEQAVKDFGRGFEEGMREADMRWQIRIRGYCTRAPTEPSA